MSCWGNGFCCLDCTRAASFGIDSDSYRSESDDENHGKGPDHGMDPDHGNGPDHGMDPDHGIAPDPGQNASDRAGNGVDDNASSDKLEGATGLSGAFEREVVTVESDEEDVTSGLSEERLPAAELLDAATPTAAVGPPTNVALTCAAATATDGITHAAAAVESVDASVVENVSFSTVQLQTADHGESSEGRMVINDIVGSGPNLGCCAPGCDRDFYDDCRECERDGKGEYPCFCGLHLNHNDHVLIVTSTKVVQKLNNVSVPNNSVDRRYLCNRTWDVACLAAPMTFMMTAESVSATRRENIRAIALCISITVSMLCC